MKGNLSVHRIWTDWRMRSSEKAGNRFPYFIYKSIQSFRNGQQNSSGHILV